MTTNSTTPADETTLFLGDGWSDPIEAGVRDRILDFIEELIEEELAAGRRLLKLSIFYAVACRS